MRYYSNDYRDEVIASLNGLFSALDDSYTVAICNVPDSETEAMNSYKESAIDAANQASASIDNLSTKIETVVSQLNDFYQYVDATGGEIYSRAADISSMLIRTNSVVDEICDILNGVGDYSGYKASPDLLDTACLPLAEVEEDREAYWNDFYLDEDGLVDAAAVATTYELIGEPTGYDGDGLPTYSSDGERILDIYTEFSVNYLSREDCTTEMVESLTNANLAAGMIPSEDDLENNMYISTPSPDSEIVTIDGVDYYVVYFPYESSVNLEEYNRRVYQLSEERYCNSINEPYNVENVNQYLDIMRTFTMDHHNLGNSNEPFDYNVAVPTLIPVSEVDPTTINTDNHFYTNFEIPPYSGLVSISEEGDHLIVQIDSTIDGGDYQVVFFSTDRAFQEGNAYDPGTAPLTGVYPSSGEYMFFYPCEYFEVYSSTTPSTFTEMSPTPEEILLITTAIGEPILDRLSDGFTWGDFIFAFLDYVKEEGLIIDSAGYELASSIEGTVSAEFGVFMFFVDRVRESYENNMALDQDEVDNLNDMAASLASFCDNVQGGYVVLHNDSGIDNFELPQEYFPMYGVWSSESVNNSMYSNGLGVPEN